MNFDIARMDLRSRRRSITWVTIGMGIYAFLLVAMYPAVKSDASLGALTANNPTIAALLGVNGSFTSPAGWINGNLYANFLPLMALLLTVGYGASCIAGQSEDGALGMIATLPISRSQLIREKSSVLMLLSFPACLVTFACVLIGRQYDLTLPLLPLLGTTLAVLLVAIDFGLAALAIGAFTGSRGTALGLTSAVAAGSYLISSLGSIVGWLKPIRSVSLFYWAVGGNQLSSGPSPLGFTVLLLSGVGICLATIKLFQGLDIK